ncbi:MAG TPA: SAM-dependent chlorinase/fluorinase [Flavobacterium sp.]|nr:SAM-dependent chlorinase/fluorinase [Flavobacterium sp.]
MIITLTSDFGLKDHYVGALKGMIYSRLSGVNIVDVSHQISPFALQEAAFLVNATYRHFPQKTIHLILVDAEISLTKKPVIVVWDNHYFISADSGVLSLLTANKQPEAIILLPFQEGENATELFVNAASEIANGKSVYEMGEPLDSLKEHQAQRAIVSTDDKQIVGRIIYIDNYGNAVSNISKDLFERTRNGREYEIIFRSYSIPKIYNKYIEFGEEATAEIGDKLAIFNSSGFLEIGIYKGSNRSGGTASSLLGIEYESTIAVRFK